MTTLCLIISLGKKNKAILSIKAQKYQALKLKKKEIYVFSTINPSMNKKIQ